MKLTETALPVLEAEMRSIVNRHTGSPSLLLGMIRYHMGWVDQEFRPAQGNHGKRIRPLMLLLASEAAGGTWTQALPAAAAVELLHNFTLIHDDIEDRDALRRGRPTLWSIWGVPQAINAGDALFAISYEALLTLRERAVGDGQIVAAVTRYTEAVIGITEGQSMDLAFEDTASVDETTYLKMVEGKTARLLGLAAELGGIVAGAPDQATTALREFGEALGMAFQMLDDVLGLWGNPLETGKPVGSDLLNRKKTLPIIHGIRNSRDFRDLLQAPELGPTEVARAIAELDAAGSRAHAERLAVAYHAQASEALDRAGGTGSAREAMVELAEHLLTRRR
jgi:geranylgeranyl diphosphate synthase type I